MTLVILSTLLAYPVSYVSVGFIDKLSEAIFGDHMLFYPFAVAIIVFSMAFYKLLMKVASGFGAS
jgi:hypothetical protein